MNKQYFAPALLLAFAVICCSGCGNASAKLAQQADPPADGAPLTQTGQLGQIFTLATSTAATYSNPSGGLEPMPSTSLNFQAQAAGFLTIAFSARGSVQPSGSQIVPIVFIECQIDGQACQPDTNTVEFLYPQFCCDTRSFNWTAADVAPGNHTVQILWGMGNPTSAVLTNRSLIVQAATQ